MRTINFIAKGNRCDRIERRERGGEGTIHTDSLNINNV